MGQKVTPKGVAQRKSFAYQVGYAVGYGLIVAMLFSFSFVLWVAVVSIAVRVARIWGWL